MYFLLITQDLVLSLFEELSVVSEGALTEVPFSFDVVLPPLIYVIDEGFSDFYVFYMGRTVPLTRLGSQ